MRRSCEGTKFDLIYISLYSICFGIIINWAILFLFTEIKLSIFLIFFVVFHFLEFASSAIFNPKNASSESFLLNNGAAYYLALACGLGEYLLLRSSNQKLLDGWFWTGLGLVMIITGQVIRTLAMVHASQNFSHQIATEKAEGHELVSTGIYAYMRHPSYLGFYLWAVGLQIFLGNIVTSGIYIIILHEFFRKRIIVEEMLLEKFFGQRYVKYREKVGTWMPFLL